VGTSSSGTLLNRSHCAGCGPEEWRYDRLIAFADDYMEPVSLTVIVVKTGKDRRLVLEGVAGIDGIDFDCDSLLLDVRFGRTVVAA
jgi:hypothetical protein